jgi:recombination protein RecA
VIQKSGAWFAYGDERLGQGRENAKQFLKENEEVRGRILAQIYEKIGLDRPDASPDGQQEEGVEEPVERLSRYPS